jgi:hypothetical protein
MDFQPLMLYDENVDGLVRTEQFARSRKISEIGKAWGLSIEDTIGNIDLRGSLREALIKHVEEGGSASVLSAEFVGRSNNAFWSLIEKHKKDYGKILEDWKKWFAREASKLQ